MTICKEILYFVGYTVYWMNGGEFHYIDDEMNLLKIEKPEDEYTFLLRLREDSIQ